METKLSDTLSFMSALMSCCWFYWFHWGFFLIVWREINPERKRGREPELLNVTLGAPCRSTPLCSDFQWLNCCLLWWKYTYFIYACEPPTCLNTHSTCTDSSCFCFCVIAREEIWSAALTDKITDAKRLVVPVHSTGPVWKVIHDKNNESTQLISVVNSVVECN